ncbi:acyltransferase family protein [Rhodopseudomonas palustris]|uniref:acyltransferase family protein n=1 Tax=Rhodopseudomonas palustris TaxID=1076 RepID=UPI000E5BFA33|nr:acyltransferase family protein [Rhodopseudomonas palustris]QLH69742.1 acyltransferase family protein [Rhodopseudomonas palustris]RIA03008.1 acyltransferase [Rhodopseudomonas palustris]
MTANGTLAPRMHGGRVDWVDYAKGICIIMVVMMHSVLGVEAAAGQTSFMHYVVEFARPFRMPDFFLISGLFLSVVIDRGWRTYLDRKVVHFAYFYVLWVTIQFAFKAPSFAAEMGWAGVAKLYALSFIDPFGTLWFIYLLPIFFVVTKLTRRLPPLLIWGVAALLESLHVTTGWMVPDEFSARFFYFYTGYLFARHVFAFSDSARARPALTLLGLAAWAVVNAVLVHVGAADLPVISLLLGLAGACAIITVGTLLAEKRWLDGLRFCGEHSIVIYLAFFLPMAISRSLLLKYAPFLDLGVIAIIVNIAGVVGALIIWKLAMKSGATFLFERPDAFRIAPRKKTPRLQAAE